jgi:glycosyltransferase involved in cell wall biosynthesis
MSGRKPVICIVDGSADVSGAFVAARREAVLMAEDAEFVLFMSNKSRIAEEQLKPFARIYRLPILSLRKSAGSALIYVPALVYCSWRMRRALKAEKCGRLQLNDFHFAHGAVLRIYRYRGRIVTWVRVNPGRFGLIGRAWLTLARWCSDELVAVSNSVRRRLPWPGRVRVVYDPSPDAPILGPSPEPNFVLMGNFDPGKGHDAAIAAFHKVARKHRAAKLLLYGSDMGLGGQKSNVDQLREAAESGAGAGRIHFEAFVDQPVDALRNARAALSFSRSESFSLACQEAGAHGLPVIATRSGGPEEIVEDGVSGFLVDVDDVPAMARRMDELLSDPQLAQTLGAAGAALVRERFPAERYKEQFREVFDL